MKAFATVIGFLAISGIANAAPLVPTTSSTRDCTAQVTDVTYKVNAVCFKNSTGELALWFKKEVLKSLNETSINPKYIRNATEACGGTNMYEYRDLFGDKKRPEAEIVDKPVEIAYSHVNLEACFK